MTDLKLISNFIVQLFWVHRHSILVYTSSLFIDFILHIEYRKDLVISTRVIYCREKYRNNYRNNFNVNIHFLPNFSSKCMENQVNSRNSSVLVLSENKTVFLQVKNIHRNQLQSFVPYVFKIHKIIMYEKLVLNLEQQTPFN